MICRMCILESINVMGIFESGRSKYNVAETIFQHFRFQPSSDDSISKVICLSCWAQIENFHDYYLAVEDAQKRIGRLSITKDILSDVKEVKLEYEVQPIESVVMNDGNSDVWCTELVAKHENSTDSGDNIKCDTYEDALKDDIDGDVSGLEVNCDFNDAIEAITLPKMKLPINLTNSGKKADSEAIDEKPSVRKKRGRKRKSETETQSSKPSKPKTEAPKQFAYYDEEITKMINLKCDLCAQEFAKFALLQRHYRGAHKMKGYAVCCLKKFYKRSLFYDHLIGHVEPEKLRCEMCNKNYANNKSLRNHMQAQHGSVNNAKIFQCDKCPRRFAKEYQLKYHSKNHMEMEANSNFPCDDCGKVFNTSSSLYAHRRTIHEQAYSYMCDICAKVMRSRTQFEKHKLEHEGISEPMQQCSLCERWYKNMARLKRHLKMHKVSEEQLICKYCEKISPSLSALRSHVKYVHQAQRLHKCSLCDKAFKKKVALREHMTTHTGDVLYTCPHCPKTFNSRANMHSHRKKVHRNEWEEARMNRGLPPEMTTTSHTLISKQLLDA